MKVIEKTAVEAEESKSELVSAVRKAIDRIAGDQEKAAQEAFRASLQRLLDNRYYLVRNATIEGVESPVPFVLVGPPGIRVIFVVGRKGIYRAKEDVWEVMDQHTHRFYAPKFNLLKDVRQMAQAVKSFLENRNLIDELEVEPVLFFAHPGAHVDSVRAIVRVVLADALERYAAGYVQGKAVLDAESVQQVVRALAGDPKNFLYSGLVPERDAFSFRDIRDKNGKPAERVIVEVHEPGFLKQVPFSTRQWVLLAAMSFFNIVLLVVFVMLVLMTT